MTTDQGATGAPDKTQTSRDFTHTTALAHVHRLQGLAFAASALVEGDPEQEGLALILTETEHCLTDLAAGLGGSPR